MARNLARDWRRSARCRSCLVPMVSLEEVQEFGEAVPDPALRADDRLADEETAHVVREAVFRLSEEMRELVLLHFLEEMPQAEFARLLEVSPSTVSRGLSAAL